jgi:hypothetical protein
MMGVWVIGGLLLTLICRKIAAKQFGPVVGVAVLLSPKCGRPRRCCGKRNENFQRL